MSQGKAVEGFWQVAAQPDQIFIFIRVNKTVGTLWIIQRIECCDVQAEPSYQLVNWNFIVAPIGMGLAIILKQQAGCYPLPASACYYPR